MSSKRGRKRNDNLPPNRARDVQRAFRARRAAHLQALEQRVTELEEENDCLRQALNLPPANRPPLGKGPTGKDKPRLPEQLGASSSATGSVTSTVASLLSSRDSSSAESPTSTRAESHSPPALGSTPRSAPPPLDSQPSWDQGMLNTMGDHGHHHTHHHPQHHHPTPVDLSAPPSSSSSYHLPPMSAPPPPSSKPQQLQYHYGSGNSPTPSSPSVRGPVPASVYVNYSHSTDRPMENPYPSASSSSNYSVRNDEDPRQYSPYAPSSYESPTSMHHHAAHHHPSMQPHASHREAPPSPAISYPPRRELSGGGGSYGIGDHFPHLPTPGGSSNSIRLPSPPNLPVGMGGPMPSQTHHPPQHPQQQQHRPYEGRMHPMP